MSRRREDARGGMMSAGFGGSDGFLSMSRFASMSFDDASSAMGRSHSSVAQIAGSTGRSRSFRVERRDSGGTRAMRQQPQPQPQPNFAEDAIASLFRFPQDMLTTLGMDDAPQRRAPRTFVARPRSRQRDDGFDEYQALQMLDEDVVKRGVSERKLRSLPVRPVTRHSAQDDKCNICQYEYRDSEKVMHLPCKHQFHPDCIRGWFKNNRTCPICRYEVEA